MSSSRETFLQRVRQAVKAGNLPGQSSPLPSREGLGYQGAGSDPVGRFITELQNAGGKAYRVPNARAAQTTVLELLASIPIQKVLLGTGEFVDPLQLAGLLRQRGLEVVEVAALKEADSRAAFFAADIGISSAAYLLAETGSVVVRTAPDQPRSLSLLPPIHVVIAHRQQILPDLFDLFAPENLLLAEGMPACLSLITGPSKTGDIELRLVTGVHGPGQVHVVLLDPESP